MICSSDFRCSSMQLLQTSSSCFCSLASGSGSGSASAYKMVSVLECIYVLYSSLMCMNVCTIHTSVTPVCTGQEMFTSGDQTTRDIGVNSVL